jgi:hypothetical protein
VTDAAPADLESWILRAREVADEVVVTVDGSADPRSVELARRLADTVAVAELPGVANPAYAWTAGLARGDWVLMLDDDELLAPGFAQAVRALVEDRRFTHYHLPVRWVVPRGDGTYGYIHQFPWWPNHATRLFRNVGGLARHAAEPHSSWEVSGEGAALSDDDVSIYHLDLVLRDRAEREAKVAATYRQPGAATCEEYYLYEDYADDLELAPVPPGVLGPGGRPAPRPRPSGLARALRRRRQPVRHVSLGELEAFVGERSDHPAIWSAQYVEHATPGTLGANRGYSVPVTVRNASLATWSSRGDVHGRVLLSYRWFREGYPDPVVPQGDISLLPHALAPGDTAVIQAGLWTPREPGRYRLEWDMLCERVSWFSARDVAPLAVPVTVVDIGPRPGAPHFAPAPDDAASSARRR